MNVYDSELPDNMINKDFIDFVCPAEELDEITIHLLRLTGLYIKKLPREDKLKLLKLWNEILGIK